MRLIQFEQDGIRKIGVQVSNGDVCDLTANNFPDNMIELLKGGKKSLFMAERIALSYENNIPEKLVPKNTVKLLPPITDCDKVICVGMNYRNHFSELRMTVPEEPMMFSKLPSAIIGDGDDIIIPKLSTSVDFEVELAVVIGKEGKNIKEEEAGEYIAGYTVANDVTARDWQMNKNAQQWLLGKSFDTFCPIGPTLVTKDCVRNPENLQITCHVNETIMQHSNTNQLVFSINKCIAWLSQICTLKVGDLLLTGTPPGAGIFRKPAVYLKDGDVVKCEIENVGKLVNYARDEKD